MRNVVSELLRRTVKTGLTLAAALAAAFASAQGHVPNRLLVKFTAGTSESRAQEVLDAVGGRIDRELPGIGVHVVELPPSANEEAIAKSLAKRPNVEFAELDAYLTPSSV